MYTLEINGAVYDYEARNSNHAIRRAVKTISMLNAVHVSARVSNADMEVAVINLSNNLGGALTINGVSYDKSDWYVSFPG